MFSAIIKRIRSINYSSSIYEHTAFITVGFLSGLICCMYAVLFSRVEKFAVQLYSANTALHFFLAPSVMLLSYYLVRRFAPGAFGSGIPQVMVCIAEKNNHLLDSLLGLKVIFVKLGSSLCGIFSGAAIGREGPSIQISASVAYLVSRFCERHKINVKRNQLILAGSAGGLAAAFNTPIGGIVYAIEELSHDHIRSYKTVLLMSVLIAGFTAQLFMGNYLYLGFPKVLTVVTFKIIFATIAVSLISGIMGGLFSTLLFKFIEWRRSLRKTFQVLVLLCIGIFLVLSFHYFGNRSIFSGKESINLVLFDHINISTSDFIFRFISPLLSSMTGIAGGIFAPSLSVGATLGGLLSQIFDPEMQTLLGLVGMIGFLNGVTKAPITSFVLVLEMTDRHTTVFPMMLSALFSSLGSYIISHDSYYELTARRIVEKGF